MNIREAFSLKNVSGDVGIEIEVEGMNLCEVDNEYWSSKEDGSLKGGMESYEYVLNCPLDTNGIKDALENLNFRLKNSSVVETVYAGIHVHINVQLLSMKQLINYICAFIVLEEPLVDWCGNTRVGNHFCLRTVDAQDLIEYIRNMILDGKFKHRDLLDDVRYGSFNIKSIPMYGSLEFRTLKSTLDINRIMTWVETLLKLKEYAVKFDSPDKMMKQISSDYRTFVYEALGDYGPIFLHPGWEKKIRQGVFRAQDIAFVKNWNKIDLNIFKARGLF